ncbi:polysaccharide deacetylase family protein [Thalassotalea sp. PS06]|uniref:polysaccharide deacetylase family protein n=1 Tax=Thalassotalea sp. PS06 TaxID=2594005 RepID=UPI00116464EB|nr:polysaccharide deacetylase family protein [Thalassotalea sp. PS06]QDO99968.1 polysaccharide deacetylase family protein [Thalassotalea sp. PS06]
MDYKADIFKYSGLGWLLWRFRPDGLYGFNYHRIGDPADTQYDPNLFSCSAEQFETHLKFYKQNFDVVSTKELIALMRNDTPIKERLAVITFDDGYHDNYQYAYPLLKAANVPATFFIATDFIDNPSVPWWDEVAWLLKNTQVSSALLNKWQLPIKWPELPETEKIRVMLRYIKQNHRVTMPDKLAMLRQACGIDENEVTMSQSLFMDWNMLREVIANGVSIGSQTCSHQILSHLEEEQQEKEIINSKLRLEEQLGSTINTFAYPVGGEHTYNQTTMNLLRKSGYQLAFTFLHNYCTNLLENRFELPRFSVDNQCSVGDLKYNVSKNMFNHRLSPFSKDNHLSGLYQDK